MTDNSTTGFLATREVLIGLSLAAAPLLLVLALVLVVIAS
jgi:hypothetical protein